MQDETIIRAWEQIIQQLKNISRALDEIAREIRTR